MHFLVCQVPFYLNTIQGIELVTLLDNYEAADSTVCMVKTTYSNFEIWKYIVFPVFLLFRKTRNKAMLAAKSG